MKMKVTNLKRRLLCGSAAAISAVSAFAPAFADDPDTGAIIGQILGIVFKLFFYIGIVLMVWSIGMLVLAFKNEDADSKSRAIMLLIVSIVLIGLGTLVKPIVQSIDNTIVF